MPSQGLLQRRIRAGADRSDRPARGGQSEHPSVMASHRHLGLSPVYLGAGRRILGGFERPHHKPAAVRWRWSSRHRQLSGRRDSGRHAVRSTCREIPRMIHSDVPLEVSLMAKMPSIIPVSDLRQDAARVLKKTRSSDEPVFITAAGPCDGGLDEHRGRSSDPRTSESSCSSWPEARRRSRAESAMTSTASWPKPISSWRKSEHASPLHRDGAGPVPGCDRVPSAEKARRPLGHSASDPRRHSNGSSGFPIRGPSSTEFPELPYREVYVEPYRFFYQVREKTVWVVAVWHGAQIPEEPDQDD